MVVKADYTGSGRIASSPRQLSWNRISSASTTSVEYVVGVRTCWVGGRAREDRRLGNKKIKKGLSALRCLGWEVEGSRRLRASAEKNRA